MDKFLSCDWGTSSFRLRLVKVPGLTILKETVTDRGIAETAQLWNNAGMAEEERLFFYLDIIHAHVHDFEKALGYALSETPMVLSGMASSSIGMIGIPYKQVPFSLDGSDLITKTVTAGEVRKAVVVVSGAATSDDVLRGEETQLVGCSHHNEETGQSLFIFPGTHSIHVVVERNRVVGFKTYMTGEFFKLLSTESILSASVEKGSGLLDEKNKRSFEIGVEESTKTNLLHGSFKVRTNQLFNRLSKNENYYYLSGLLIGTEMKELINTNFKRSVLVTTQRLQPYYEAAIRMLNSDISLEVQDADECLIRGQFQILERAQ